MQIITLIPESINKRWNWTCYIQTLWYNFDFIL